MKKERWTRIFATVLAMATMFVGLTACKQPQTENPNETDTPKAATVVINDFSDTFALYQLIPQNMFGKISWNNDKQYVLTGNGSAKLEPDMNATAEPYFTQRLTSEDFDYNHGDINMATKITAQVYNASETNMTIQTDIQFSNKEKTTRETTTLKAGEWNTITYKIYPELLSLRFNTSEAMYINYYVTRKAMAEQPVLYLDNISISYTDEAAEPIQIELDEGEFCSFDKNYQVFLPYLKGWGNYLQEVQELTLSANPKYTVGGTGFSYKMRTVAGIDPNQSYWVYFPETLCKAAKLNEVTANDKFEFSVYNVGVKSKLIVQIFYTLTLQDGTSQEVFAPTFHDLSAWSGVYGKGWNYDVVSLAIDDWTKISIDFGALEETTKAAIKEKFGVEDYNVLGNLTKVAVAWTAFNDVAERTFYLDDMKIVKGE